MKKKKSKKQASDFAKELDEMDAEDNEGDAVPDIEGDLGDDVFEKSGTAGEVDSGRDAWVLEGREATYPEVSRIPVLNKRKLTSSYSRDSSPCSMPTIPNSPARSEDTPLSRLRSLVKERKRLSSPTSWISVDECTDSQNTLFSSCTRSWERRVRLMVNSG